MYSLLSALKETQTGSVRNFRSKLSSERSSVVQLLQTHRIHRLYKTSGGRKSGLGFPIGQVQVDDKGKASRRYRGGEVFATREGSTEAWVRQVADVNYLGFHCHEMQGGLGSDEPYFVIAVDIGTGSPLATKTFKYENVEENTEMGGDYIVKNVTPDPMNIRVIGFEHDAGDPEQTAQNVQNELVKLSQEAAGWGGESEDAADSPAGDAAVAGGALSGAWGALLAFAIVEVFGMGDDFIAQGLKNVFTPPPNVPETPPNLGTFQGDPYNVSIVLDGEDEKYTLYFQVTVQTKITKLEGPS